MMDAETFVEAIKLVVRDSSARGVCEEMTKPSGRKPPADLLAMSEWFNSLSEEEQANVRKVAEMSADAATFGFLCAIDGVLAIEGYGEKGDLVLLFHKHGEEIVLNDPHGEMLHDIYNAVADEIS